MQGLLIGLPHRATPVAAHRLRLGLAVSLPRTALEHVNPGARCLVNLTYEYVSGRVGLADRTVPEGAALAGALQLSLSAVATRLWICPGRILCRPAHQSEPNQSEPPLSLALPHGILQFLWDFEIAFSTFRSPVQEAAHHQFPAQDLSFSAISPLWGCGKDCAQLSSALSRYCWPPILLRATPLKEGG